MGCYTSSQVPFHFCAALNSFLDKLPSGVSLYSENIYLLDLHVAAI